MTNQKTFEPDWVSPPGETIAKILNSRGLSLADLAQKIDVSLAVAEDLMYGAAAIDEALAQRLAAVFGASPQFWINRERQFRLDTERLREAFGDTPSREWLRELPVRDMVKFGWIRRSTDLSEKVNILLRFFGVSDIASWRAKFRTELAVAAFRTSTSVSSNPAAVAAWLRWAEIESREISCDPWSPVEFRKTLRNIRRLTRLKDPTQFIPRLQQLCAKCGVAVIIAPTPKGCPASGATRFLSPTKALIILSFRYRSDDHFWFTFFHEAGHLVLHSRNALFLEDGSEVTNDEEAEANEFAERMLIPPEMSQQFLRLRPRTRDVIRFAVKAGVSPGIVVGQLQHKGQIGYNRLNSLKRRYMWADFSHR